MGGGMDYGKGKRTDGLEDREDVWEMVKLTARKPAHHLYCHNHNHHITVNYHHKRTNISPTKHALSAHWQRR
jgi:hypothetical protein